MLQNTVSHWSQFELHVVHAAFIISLSFHTRDTTGTSLTDYIMSMNKHIPIPWFK
jgi:hypothetical protein